MAKVWEYTKVAVNGYVTFIQDWPGFVGLIWPVTIVIAIAYF